LLSVGDPQPYLHQTPLDLSGLPNVRQWWLPTDNNLLLSRTFSNAIDIVNNQFVDGASLQQYPPNSGANQQWRLDDWQNDPSQKIIANATQPFVIDIPDGNARADPQLYHRHEGPNQRWTASLPLTQIVGVFKIHSKVGGVLDVPGGSQDPGTIVQQFHDGGRLCFNQFWRFLDPNGNEVEAFHSGDSVQIVSLCNDMALQPIGPAGGQSWVRQTPAALGDPNQLWTLQVNGVDVLVQPASDASVAMDLQNGDPSDNVLIQVFPVNGGNNQLWNFV
jgi:hypothetical protein